MIVTLSQSHLNVTHVYLNIKNYNGEPNSGWDIDHIIPISSAESEDDIIKLNHYTNLQPLCSYINRVVKRDKINLTHFF
jgi:hypothetical protein